MGKVLEQTSCPRPNCGSSDAFTVYQEDNGDINAWCYSCAAYFKYDKSRECYISNRDEEMYSKNNNTTTDFVQSPSAATQFVDKVSGVDEALMHPIRELKERSISYATAEKYGVRVGVDVRDGITPIYTLFPCHKGDSLTGFIQKSVTPEGNSYRAISDCKGCDLFGLSTIPRKGKKLFITEGQEDCLSLYQVLKEQSSIDWEPAVVAIGGSLSKVNCIFENVNNVSIIDNYEEIILALDQDHAGKEAANKIAKLLAGKAYIATFPLKDPNEMLKAGKGDELKWAVLTRAKKYQPDGIVNAKDAWDRYKAAKKVEYYPFPEYMTELNKMLYGAKAGTVTTLGAGTSIGKTTVLRALKYHFLTTTDQKIADIELEADINETLKSLVGLKLGKRITLPDVEVEASVEEKAYEDLFSTGRYTLYDFFGGMDDESLFSKLRYFANTGHKFIFLDHLSIIVSEYASEGGERERIDTIMTKLAKLAKETNTCIFLVVHLKKSENGKESFEKGAIPDLDDLRGSSSIKQLSWDVVFLSRNTQHPDPECAKITELTSAKCRLTGRTGNAGYIKFDENTGRYVGVTPPPNYYMKKEKKGF